LKNILVIKLGGASVASIEQFAKMAELIAMRLTEYPQIVIVVSAMGDTTDRLIQLAHEVNKTPAQREYDMLLTSGERISIALLAMALDNIGIRAVSFTGSQSGIITCPHHQQAKIIDVRPHRILRCVEEGKIAIVAGFQGVSQNHEITTLGRGGSDTSAVALAVALNACRVEFYKDVPGIYEKDPKTHPHAQFLYQLSYEKALEIADSGAQVLSKRCILLAQKNGLQLIVRSFNYKDYPTYLASTISSLSSLTPLEKVYEQDCVLT
jgi:aspartate kinase